MGVLAAVKSIVRKNSAGSEFIRRRLNLIEGTNVTLTVADDPSNSEVDITIAAAGAAGAPSTVDYLVGTADAGLSAEIVVGTTPGGELGGTWAAPTVDATHSGSAHHAQGHDHTGADSSGVLTNDEHDGYEELAEVTAPATPAANKVRVYAKDKAGVSELFYKNDAGTERDLSASGGSGYSTVEDEGTAQTARTTIDFVGQGVIADDFGAETRIRIRDYKTLLQEDDDFLTSGTNSGAIGKLGWFFATGTIALLVGEAGRPGILRQTTGAAANNFSVIRPAPTNSSTPILPAETFDIVGILRFNQNTAEVRRFGLASDAIADPAVDGIWFEALAADTNWFRVTRAADVQTRTDHGVATGTGWVKFRVRRKDASTISFSINDGAEADVTTNIPTAVLGVTFFIKTTEAVAKSGDIDYFSIQITGLAR